MNSSTAPHAPMAKPTLYLASPYGFSAHWRSRLLPDFVEALEQLGIEVWEPFTRNGQVDLAQPGWEIGRAHV